MLCAAAARVGPVRAAWWAVWDGAAPARAHVPPARPGRRRRPSACTCRGVLDLSVATGAPWAVHDRADLDAQAPCARARDGARPRGRPARAGRRVGGPPRARRPRGGGRPAPASWRRPRRDLEPGRRAARRGRTGRERARLDRRRCRSTSRRSRSTGSTASAGCASRRWRRARGARTARARVGLRAAVRAFAGSLPARGRPRAGAVERHRRAGRRVDAPVAPGRTSTPAGWGAGRTVAINVDRRVAGARGRR